MISQVVTAVIFGVILIISQAFSVTQQPLWAQPQPQQSPSSPSSSPPPPSSSNFGQFAQRVREVVQAAGATGSVEEFPGENSTQFWWSEGNMVQCLEETEAACTSIDTRIYIESVENDALERFNTILEGADRQYLEEFDLGTSQNGYASNFSFAQFNPSLEGRALYEGRASGDAVFTCGTITGTVTKLSRTSIEKAPPNATDEQLESISQQKKSEADAIAPAHRAEVKSLAKTIVQALLTNGLCNTPSETCPIDPLTQDGTTTGTTATGTTTPSSSSFAQKESDLLVDTSSNNNNGHESVQHATTTSTGQIANMATDYESSSLSSSAGAVYPVSPQQPSTSSSKAGAYNVYPWKFNYEIVNGYGLVLTDIRANNKPVFESVSVPYFKIWYAGGTNSKIIEYLDGCDKTTELRIDKSLANGIDVLRWSFQKEFDEADLKGTLSINYDIFMRFKATNDCEGSQSDCYRFIPRVSFSWSDKSQSQPTLDAFKAYYKLDYGKTGLAKVKDTDSYWKFPFVNFGWQYILTNEDKFTAVQIGHIGEHDNIHTAPPGKGVWLPGCTNIPFDCLHNHWRWSKIEREWRNLWGWASVPAGLLFDKSAVGGSLRNPNVDPMVDPSSSVAIDKSLRGTPYLVPDQTIEIVIAEQKPDEDKPIDPDLVLTLADDDALITTLPEKDKLNRRTADVTQVQDRFKVGEPKDVVVWYVALVNNKASDTFYRHGIFVLDPKAVTVTSREAIQNVYTDLAASSEIDANKKTQLLAHLNESIQEKYWMADDNNILIPENIERPFAELTQTVSLMQQVKNERPDLAQTMDLYTFRVLYALLNSVGNTLVNEVANIKTSIVVNESQLDTLFAENEALSQSIERYNAALDEPSLTNAAQIVDNFRDSLKNGIQGIREVSNALNQSQQPTSATSTTTTNTTTTTSTSPSSTNITDTNRTTPTPTTPTLPSITAVDLHPDSVPQFFKCGETPDNGSPTLPGLDVQSSAYTAITDGDVNTEILGKAIFDVTLSEPIVNGPGPDLRIYEIGNDPEPFSVALFSGDILTQVIQYTAVASATGDTDDCGFGVNIAEIDLSDFGLGEEGQSGNEEIIAVTGIRADNLGAEGCCTGADISDVVIVSPTEAATTTEDVPLLPGQQQVQQQDDESDAEEEGTGEELALTQCDPSYPDVCIPLPPPDLNCGDEGVPENFQILPPNPHGFDDEDNDGIGCESEQASIDRTELSDNNDDDTQPESEIEEDAEPEPSDSGDEEEEEDEDDDTSED